MMQDSRMLLLLSEEVNWDMMSHCQSRRYCKEVCGFLHLQVVTADQMNTKVEYLHPGY